MASLMYTQDSEYQGPEVAAQRRISLPFSEGSVLQGIEGERATPFTTISAMVKVVNARLRLLQKGGSSDQFVV